MKIILVLDFLGGFLSKLRKKLKKKIISSQPKSIVCFGKPTKTQNTFFVSRGIFSDTKCIVWESQISQASVFIY